MIAAVMNDGLALRHACKELQGDRDLNVAILSGRYGEKASEHPGLARDITIHHAVTPFTVWTTPD